MSLVTEATLDDVPDGKKVLAVLNQEGDLRVTWDANVPAEVEHARQTFEQMVAKGYQAYAVRRNGEKGERIRAFDDQADKIILAPALRGG